MRIAITTYRNDRTCDVRAGTDITGPVIGAIGYDDGLVLTIDGNDETYLPDSVGEAVKILAQAGYQITPESVAEIAGLDA